MAGPVGIGGCSDRDGRRTSVGQRDDPLESGRGLAGDQASRTARPLANRPHGRYRLSCPAEFSYRGDEVAARPPRGRSATTSATTRHGTAGTWTPRGRPRRSPRRWMTCGRPGAGGGRQPGPPRRGRRRAGGNILGAGNDRPGPGRAARHRRDGRLRAAVTTSSPPRGSTVPRVVIEDLDFAAAAPRDASATAAALARQARQGLPAAGLRHPTGKFRDRLAQMANAGLPVIVVDPAYTSRWRASTGSPRSRSTTPRRPATTR